MSYFGITRLMGAPEEARMKIIHLHIYIWSEVLIIAEFPPLDIFFPLQEAAIAREWPWMVKNIDKVTRNIR